MDKEKTEYWILLYLTDRSRKKAIAPTTLFEERPAFVTDNFGEFFNLLREMESNKLIDSVGSVSPLFKINEEGKKKIKKYINNPARFLNFCSLVPNIEIKYRLRTLEGFIGTFILLLIMGVISFTLITFNVTNEFIKYIALTFLFLFLGMFIVSGVFVLFNFLYGFLRFTSLSVSRFFYHRRKIIASILMISLMVGGVAIFIRFTNFTLMDIAFELITTSIIGMLLYFKDLRQKAIKGIIRIFKKT